MNSNFREKEKKPYEKPEIRAIDLAADEVLAVGCKTPTTFPVSGGGPAPGCLTNTCSQDGS